MRNKTIMFLFVFAFALQSCKKDNELKTIDLGVNYYPLNIGTSIIYDIDSIVYDKFLDDTLYFSFQLKETIVSEFEDNAGDVTYRLERYKRATESDVWQVSDVWVVNKLESRIERVEDNKRIIPIIFPVREGESWNGNALNNDSEMEFIYKDVDKPFEVNNARFDSTLKVIQRESVNLVEDTTVKEFYAKNLGLVYKEVKNLKFYEEISNSGIFKPEGFEYYLKYKYAE